MTVNRTCFLFFLLPFLASVDSTPVCSKPYSCITTSECAERHSARGTEEVLFHCEGNEKICCPPVKYSLPSTVEVNNYYTTEPSRGKDSTRTPSQPDPNRDINRTRECPEERITSTIFPQRGEHDVHSHHVPPKPTESRRPFRPESPESRRPPQHSEITPHLPQSPQGPTARPQDSRIPVYRPQVTQTSSQNPTVRPLNHQNPDRQPSLTSHRNYRLLPSVANCGVNNFANRITEGEEVYLGEYPWMVLTGLKDREGNSRWNCGGTLINGWYVLTAAHCLFVDNRTIEIVRLGEHNLANETDCNRDICLDPPEDVEIAEVIPHERWNTTTIKNDIALLRLARNPLTLGKSNIYPICLPFDMKELNITSSTKYEVAGWGKTDWNAEEGSDVLRKASISGVTREECNICKSKKKQQYCPIVDSQLCVQGWKSVDVCKGDSGGPLMVTRLNIYQIGITSFKGSEYCGAENIPSIFTKVETFLPWILDNIRQ